MSVPLGARARRARLRVFFPRVNREKNKSLFYSEDNAPRFPLKPLSLRGVRFANGIIIVYGGNALCASPPYYFLQTCSYSPILQKISRRRAEGEGGIRRHGLLCKLPAGYFLENKRMRSGTTTIIVPTQISREAYIINPFAKRTPKLFTLHCSATARASASLKQPRPSDEAVFRYSGSF